MTKVRRIRRELVLVIWVTVPIRPFAFAEEDKRLKEARVYVRQRIDPFDIGPWQSVFTRLDLGCQGKGRRLAVAVHKRNTTLFCVD